MANLLVSLGLVKGDRVHAAARPECLDRDRARRLLEGRPDLGADVDPCSPPTRSPTALNTVGVRIVITDLANLPTVEKARLLAPALEHVFLIDGAGAKCALPFRGRSKPPRDAFETVDTAADDPAFLNFTSGTTGNPKGALQAHRSMLGHMPGLELVFDSFPQPGDVHVVAGRLVVARRLDGRADAGVVSRPAGAHLSRHALRSGAGLRHDGQPPRADRLLTPTMLRGERQIPDPVKRYGVDLRSIICGGESVGKDLHEWASDALGVAVNEMFGQTECNLVLGSSGRMHAAQARVARTRHPRTCRGIVDDDGQPLPAGDVGNLAFRRPDPVMMLEYWQNPEATRTSSPATGCSPATSARCDEDGYFWFQGRADDVITSAGYRIGPSEIEDALARHPAVVMAAVIGVPDPVRTESIKAFVVLKDGISPSETLVENVRDFVRDHLARHEVPREIEFVDALPMTTTGKIMRRELREIERTKAAASRAFALTTVNRPPG